MNYKLYKKDETQLNQWVAEGFGASLIENSEEAAEFEEIPGYERILLILEGNVVLACEGESVTRLREFEQSAFTGETRAKCFGPFKGYCLAVKSEGQGIIDVLKPDTQQSAILLDVMEDYGSVSQGFFCSEGYAVVSFGEEIVMVGQGEQLFIYGDKHEHAQVGIMGEGMLIRAQVFSDRSAEAGLKVSDAEGTWSPELEKVSDVGNTRVPGGGSGTTGQGNGHNGRFVGQGQNCGQSEELSRGQNCGQPEELSEGQNGTQLGGRSNATSDGSDEGQLAAQRKGQLGETFDVQRSKHKFRQKPSFDDYAQAVKISLTNVRFAKYIFKFKKNNWYDAELKRGIEKIQGKYIPAFLWLGIMLFIGAVWGQVWPSKVLIAVFAAWSLLDAIVVTPLIYLFFMPKPVRDHIKPVASLTKEEEAIREEEAEYIPGAKRVLRRYKYHKRS